MFRLGRIWSIAALAIVTAAAPSRSVPRGMDTRVRFFSPLHVGN